MQKQYKVMNLTSDSISSALANSNPYDRCSLSLLPSLEIKTAIYTPKPFFEDILDIFQKCLTQWIIPYSNQLFGNKHTFPSLLLEKVSDLCSNKHSRTCKETYDILNQLFGNKRLHRLCIRADISLDAIKESLLTIKELDALFAEAALVTKVDFEELLDEITSDTATRFNIRSRTKDLKNRFQNKSIETCSLDDLDVLHSLLVPVSSSEKIFLLGTPQVDPASIELSYREKQRMLALSCERLRNQILNKDFSKLETWEYYFAKRLSQPKLPDGLMVRHPNGYLYQSKKIKANGCYKLLFKPLGSQELTPHLLIRGTRGGEPTDKLHHVFFTLREDFTDELGANGVIATYSETKKTLDDLEGRKCTIIGYSLGGAQAQRDALLFKEQINRLVTVCAPGIDAASNQHFIEKVDSSPLNFDICHHIDAEDFVDEAGEVHLGAGISSLKKTSSSIKIFGHISPKTPEQYLDSKSLWPIRTRFSDFYSSGILGMISYFLTGGQAHLRSTPLEEKSRLISLDSHNSQHSETIDAILNHKEPYRDSRWETLRKSLCFHSSPGFARFICDTEKNQRILESDPK